MQDDATVRDLAAGDESRNVKGWLQLLYTQCFQVDLVTPVATSDTLLRIHATAEEYEATAEEAFIPFQVCHGTMSDAKRSPRELLFFSA